MSDFNGGFCFFQENLAWCLQVLLSSDWQLYSSFSGAREENLQVSYIFYPFCVSCPLIWTSSIQLVCYYIFVIKKVMCCINGCSNNRAYLNVSNNDLSESCDDATAVTTDTSYTKWRTCRWRHTWRTHFGLDKTSCMTFPQNNMYCTTTMLCPGMSMV